MKLFPTLLFAILFCYSCGTDEPTNTLFPFEENYVVPSKLSSSDKSNLLSARGRMVASVSVAHMENMLEKADKGLHIFSFYTLDCEACLETNMHLNHIETELKGADFQIFYVNLDNSLENEAVTHYVRSRGITGGVFQLRTTEGWREELQLDWDGKLPAILLVNQDLEVRQVYQQAYTYGELYALLQPYL